MKNQRISRSGLTVTKRLKINPRRTLVILSTGLVLLILYCIAGQPLALEQDNRGERVFNRLIIRSSAFTDNSPIPRQHTCDGLEISPPLYWFDIPQGTKSLALIIDDPDAPKLTWVHWIVYNIPPHTGGLSENISSHELPPGAKEGLNSWERTGYGGPCPPIGEHRYFHKLYALDIILPDLNHPNKKQLEKAMKDHILGEAELIGTYMRSR